MADYSFEIIKHIGSFSLKGEKWKKELNFIKWGDNQPKYDLRSWSEDHTKMGKGIALTREELMLLKELLIVELDKNNKQEENNYNTTIVDESGLFI